MKEATGELNMTVVTVVAIAAVGAFFYLVIWPGIRGNLLAQTHCASAVNCTGNDITKQTCQYYDENGELSDNKITCDRSGSGTNYDSTKKKQ